MLQFCLFLLQKLKKSKINKEVIWTAFIALIMVSSIIGFIYKWPLDFRRFDPTNDGLRRHLDRPDQMHNGLLSRCLDTGNLWCDMHFLGVDEICSPHRGKL